MSSWSFAFLFAVFVDVFFVTAARGQTGPCAELSEIRQASLRGIAEKLARVTALPPTLENRLEISRLFFYRAQALTEEAPRRAFLEEARAIAEAVKDEAPRHPGALLAKKNLESLVTLKEVDPSYAGHAAERELGILLDSRELLVAALDGDPAHPANRIAFADYLARHGERAAAVPLAKQAIALASDAKWAVEAADWVQKACDVLDGGG